jgi:type IV pilus assembly protein PilX
VNARARLRTAARVSRPVTRATPAPARGFSLVIAMLMLAVIGLASAAILRNAASGDQVANNNRLQTQASQYAQFALRFCERQLALPAASREAQVWAAGSPPAWTLPDSWATRGERIARTLAAADIGGAQQPRVAPQCLMEATAATHLYTVTARGFSGDFRADPLSGATTSGSVVWLQATLHAEGDGGASATPAPGASGAALTVRKRLWQQLLTPPF